MWFNSAFHALNSMHRQLWESPTITSWACVLARSLGMLLVLPLVLTRLSTPEIALWLLFSTMSGLLLVVDMGFASTFARVIAYGMGGASDIRDFGDPQRPRTPGNPNWVTVARIVGIMRRIYLGMATAWFLLLSLGGTWFVLPIIRELPSPRVGWVSWLIVIVLSTMRFYGVQFSSRLLGYNKVALIRRWETLLLMLAAFGNAVAVFSGFGLIGLVSITHGLLVVNAVVNWCLAVRAERSADTDVCHAPFEVSIFRDVWPAVWRSGVGVAMSSGVIQVTGVFYARVASSGEVAAYLLALTFVRYLTQFGQAPFYSKLPLLARFHAAGRVTEKELLAERGMRLAHWVLVVGFVSVAVLADPLLGILGSNVEFVPEALWGAMALATFVCRYGAMHLQLYSTTNDILWHIANGVSGTLYLTFVFVTLPVIGVYAFPVSQLLSDLFFYTWYSARHSYRVSQFTFWSFEARTSFVPFLVLAAYFGGTLLF